MHRRGGISAALLALACALPATALADFPYSTGSPSRYEDYRTAPGQVPSDIDHGESEWKFAATPEPGSPHVANPRELNGVRGAHLVDADATVRTAWMTTTGRPDVVIAVLDSGVMWNDAEAMKDLALKTRLGAGELPTPNHAGAPLIAGADCGTYVDADDANGDGIFDLRDFACDGRIDLTDPRRVGPAGALTPQDLLIAFSDGSDADGNGYVDDIVGWDFVDDDNDPFDDVQYGHGTGEAEDSVGETDNDNGLPGTCPNCTAMHLRVGDSFIADVNRFAQATLYAVDNGALVVQEALGTLNNSALARRSMEYAYRHGATVIASAADEAAQHHNWPSTYEHGIVVNSVTRYDEATTNNGSYLQFNGCTNFMTRVTLAIPSTSCSSNATGLAAGMAGIVYSAALNARTSGALSPSEGTCRRVDGSRCLITPNEVRQLMASGTLTPADPDAGSPDRSGLSDDVDFLGPGLECAPLPSPCDPNRNFLAAQIPPIVGPSGTVTRRYPARTGFDQYFGFGRVNMVKAVEAVSEGRIPPEAELSSPEWYEQLDPRQATIDVRGEMWARGRSYTCRVEVAPGSEPNNETEFREVPSVCSAGPRTDAFDGVVAALDVGALKARFPAGSSFDGPNPPPQTNTPVPPDPGPHLNNRPNQEPFGFTVRLVVSVEQGPATLTGQDRRNLYLHRDADLLPAFPKQLTADGASSPALADLNGDNRNELVFGTSDGRVHALRRNGRELRGWPVRGARLPLHRGARAFASGEVPAGSSRGAMLSSPAVGDLDHDGSPEVVIADFEGRVYAWTARGERLWTRRTRAAYSGRPLRPFENVRRGKRHRTQRGFIASPVLANLDASADGRLEVIAAAMDRHVYAWHARGRRVRGFPALVVDRDKITVVDPVTHAPTFRPESEIGEELNQGAIIDTPAVADLDGDRRPEIVVGTNEEYPSGADGGVNVGATTPSGALLDLLRDATDLEGGNSRLYALRPGGDPGPVALDDSPFLWKFRVGVLLTELLPIVGEGITGSPVIGRAGCGADTERPNVGIMPAAGYAYLLTAGGDSCYGKTGGNDNALATDVATGAGKYDSPAFAAVGQPAFGRLGGERSPTFLAPVAGLLRALDLAVNEYQGGQDMIAAWDPASGQFRTGWPAPVNDLQFLTGPSIADVNGDGGEEVLGGTASQDLNAFGAAGLPAGGGWPKFTADWIVANPAIGSFGERETNAATRQTVVAVTRAGTLFVYRTAAPACSGASWPRFRHDNANSGSLERDAAAPGRPFAVRRRGSSLVFRAPGDDLLCGTAVRYEVVQSREPIAPRDVDRLLRRGRGVAAPAPARPGTSQRVALRRGAGRNVAIRAVDDQGNVGHVAIAGRRAPSTGLRLAVAPRRIRAGSEVRIRFRVFRADTGRGVRDATIRLAGRSVRSGRGGRASMRVLLRRAGRHRITASRRGIGRATDSIRVLRAAGFTG